MSWVRKVLRISVARSVRDAAVKELKGVAVRERVGA